MSNCKPVETYNIKTKVVTKYKNAKECAKVLGIKPRTLHDHIARKNPYSSHKNNHLVRYNSNDKWDVTKINEKAMYEIGAGNGYGTKGTKVIVKTFRNENKCSDHLKDNLITETEYLSISAACRDIGVPYKTVHYKLCVAKFDIFARRIGKHLYQIKLLGK